LPTIIAVLSLDAIRAGAERARPFVLRTPLLPLGEDRWLKLELLQPTGSFKVRGFFSAALALPESRRRRGLLTVSAGNAALACAYVAHRLRVPCRVVMFDTAPPPKLEGVRRWGAEPVLLPRPQLLRWLSSRAWEAEPEAFIHPFASPELQAGNGGAGLEIAEQLPEVERVLVAVGGGGLVHGVSSALKALKPSVQVLGVQSDGYELWPRTFREGTPPAELAPNTIADGTAAPYDASMHERLAQSVDGWLTVPEPRLRAAIPELASAGKVVAEGAGALAFAALEQLSPGPPTVAVVSGGNVDRALLAELLAA
jgi:threo-3-hydroxy-L-aspartate ammonia-lyase